MDFKNRFKKFVNEIKEHTGKTPEDEVSHIDDFSTNPAITKFKEHINDPTDPQAEQAIIESIEEAYFQDDSFDPTLYELEKLPENLDPDQIVVDLQKLKRQHVGVSRKVSELVLENHPAYEAELQRVMELQDSLQMATVICTNSRLELNSSKSKFTTASLGLLANYKKRQQLLSVLKTLWTIRTLQRTDIRLREMVEEEDYPGAIQLCLECQKAASTFRHYKCISELSSKLQDTLEMIEEALDVALSKTCENFEEKHYEKVQMAYKLLGKTQTAMDQLHMHFTSAIHNKAFTIVLGYVELCSGTGDTNFQKRQYSDLCKNINVDVFTPCLIDLCKALWQGMKSYYKTIKWHEAHDQASNSSEAGDLVDSDVEASLNRRYVKQKLEHGCQRIWGDVQQKVKVYVLSTDLSGFKYDDFIQVLDIVRRLIQIGEEFCGSKSEGLQDSIRKQSIHYFRTYHRLRLDELRMFLENEAWELCPVKPSFSILQLQEFKFLRALTNTDLSSPQQQQQNAISKAENYFENCSNYSNPFDASEETEEQEDVLEPNGLGDGSFLVRTPSQDSDSDDDVPDELKGDFIDEGDITPPIKKLTSSKTRKTSSGKVAPIITNTTLNVCRLFGKYMQIMSVLQPIAFDVVLRMSQLFDYYLYTVYSFFAVDEELNHLNERFLSSKLRTTLKRISDNLVLHAQDVSDITEDGGNIDSNQDRVPHPHISPMVDLTSSNNLHGLAGRVVATESLIFLAEQFEFLLPHLDGMMPATKKAFLQQFYSQTVNVAPELRQPVYRNVAAHSMDHESVRMSMASVRWDIKDLMSQHNPYVDDVLKEFSQFAQRLDNVNSSVPVPRPASHVLWEHCILMANGTFVEGYASARKCSNEGRALMQLDFQQFLIKLETITDLRPIPGREFVETYIKAYYLPEASLEVWIREHKEYSPRQMLALVNCIPHISKKARQKVINLIEDIEKTRR